ncbi:hypothetical protein PL11201_160018 [Planktothrix sp. PCC 11201]|nr:hypothetical protein PL11201_160018 [Planktothrix sp. PCC 11201]
MEAWDYLENQWTQYTLVIFDWLLPGLSGIGIPLTEQSRILI